LLVRGDGYRNRERLARLAIVCEADKRGRAGLQDEPYPQGPELLRLRDAAAAVRAADVAREGLEGEALGRAIDRARIAAISAARAARAARADRPPGAATGPATG